MNYGAQSAAKQFLARWSWIVVAVCLSSQQAKASTFTVTKTADTNDGGCDSDCSLREAIIAANQHPGDDTIIVPAAIYVLRLDADETSSAAGDLDILDTVTVAGMGADATVIDANHIDRAFHIHPGAVVRLSGLTIQNGSRGEGGAIYNEGTALVLHDSILKDSAADRGAGVFNKHGSTLTLTNCTLTGNSSDNRGGGIHNEGTSTLTNCTLSDNSATIYGGGIFNNLGSTLRLTNCSLIGNSVVGGDLGYSVGGAIFNGGGMMTITSSTFSGNSATGLGGAIYNEGDSTLTNCTISGNSAAFSAGGIYAFFGMLRLTNCTVSDNSGGGVVNDGAVTAVNTIFAAGEGGPICGRSPLVSGGHNLDEDGSCRLTDPSDRVGVSANLAHLGDYGGPTQTSAPCTGAGMPESSCAAASPAIDAGDNVNCPTTDQRGAPRPSGTACDIGAYESGAQVPLPAYCSGDCDGSGVVTVNEIITLVDIAFGTQHVVHCANGLARNATDADVTVTIIIQAVNNALFDCPAS